MRSGKGVRGILLASGLVIASASPAAVVDYEITFNAITGPDGTGSFQYDDTPDAEWMSDIGVDFGSGLTATLLTPPDEFSPAWRLDPFVFGILTAPSEGPDTIAAWMEFGIVYRSENWGSDNGLLESESMDSFWLDSNRSVSHLGHHVGQFIGGPFYSFSGPGVPADFYYGTISLTKVTPVPLPAALLFFGSAVPGIGLLAWRGRSRSEDAALQRL